jgi:DNA-binding response OmpR family regulator
MAVHILLIEDDPGISAFVRQGLSELGYAVDVARDGDAGQHLARGGTHDVIILDVMLPGASGIEVCTALRRQGHKTPILMLTALSETSDKVSGLEAGADDYLVKPFEFDELAARIKALLRRGQASPTTLLRCEDLEVDLLRRQVTRAGQKIKLTAKEFALLEYLMRNPDRVLTRTSIGQHIWGMDFDYGGNVIEVYISTLRRKIDKGFGRPLIHTLIGSGYMFSSQPP